MLRPLLLFVTGKLAEPALRRLLTDLAPRLAFEYEIAVLPITVASLASTAWIARHLTIPPNVGRVVIPGLCPGDLQSIAVADGTKIERGPEDLRDLPEYLGTSAQPSYYGTYDISILAEINHAPRLSRTDHRTGALLQGFGRGLHRPRLRSRIDLDRRRRRRQKFSRRWLSRLHR